MSTDRPAPEPSDLLDQLRDAAGAPVRPPLRVPLPTTSHRARPVGPLVTGVRRTLLKIIAPSLLELIGQLETDRADLYGRVADLETRLSRLDDPAAAEGTRAE